MARCPKALFPCSARLAENRFGLYFPQWYNSPRLMKIRFRQRPHTCSPAIPGAIVGLFLARVALETARRPWPWPLIIAVCLLAALCGLALGRLLAPHPKSSIIWHWPLLIYLFWPQRAPLVAAGVATLAALVWLLSREIPSLSRWAESLADGATFAVALVVYVATAAPDVLPADAGEFQLAAALLGVPHPPGYPLYTMLGYLFTRLLPVGTPAYRLNLMSGLLAATTLVLVARATRLWARRLGASPIVALAGGLAAALTLGTATTFWAQATIANVRTLAVFFAALAFYALARFAAANDKREADHALVVLGLALGLGGSHYPPLAFVSIFFVIYLLLTDPRLLAQPRRWWRPLLVGLVSFLLPLIYLPIRGAMAAPLAPDSLDTWSGFLHHFLARGFSGDMFAFANPTDLPHRLALLPTLFPFQFNLALLAATLLGLVGLVRRDWRLFALLAGSLILHTFVTITYRAPQTVEYLMPAYLPIAIAVGLIPSLAPPRLRPLICSLLLCAALLNGYTHAPSFIELADDHSTRQTVEPLLEQAPADALILADWRWATPLWYLQKVEGLRPDVEVRYVYNVAGEEYRDTWERRVREIPPERPLLLTHFYEFPGYTTEPWGAGFLTHLRPVMEPTAPITLTEAVFGDQIQLVGYDLRQGRFSPGQLAEFVLAWRATGPLTPPPSFTLVLLDADGRRLAQADQALPTDLAPGEIRFERLALPLYPTLPPGRYRVTLGAYATTDAGFETLPTDAEADAITLAELELAPLSQPPFTLHPQAIPFEGGPTLVGVDYDRSVPDTLRVYLSWQGPIEEGVQARVQTSSGAETAAPLPPVPAGAYQTIAVDLQSHVEGPLYLSLADAQGSAKTAAGPWGWTLRAIRLPASAPSARFVPLGSDMAVIGATARPAPPGETMVLDVTLVALRPLTDDDGVSVRLMDADGRWLDRHDIQPALGAIPTLKWIRGSRVVDRHLLRVPEDFTGDEVKAALVAYERFRMTPLVPLDGRFSEVPLGAWSIP